jgi:hypothetical protein
MSIFAKRRKVRLSQHRMVESPHGRLRISHDRWPSVVALVDGPGIPAVTVLPGRGMSVNGQRMPARQGTRRGWDPRRKARVCTVLAGDRGYELRRTGLLRARLLRGGVLIATARGRLAGYSPLRNIPGIDARLSWSDGVDPTDVAIGQAMVVAFGAGAPGALARLVFFWLEWISG